MHADGRCRSCKAPIRWVVTLPNGKRMPLDPIPDPDGNVWIDHIEEGMPYVNIVLTGEDVPRNIANRYVSHFVTCPNADSWRKPKERSQ